MPVYKCKRNCIFRGLYTNAGKDVVIGDIKHLSASEVETLERNFEEIKTGTKDAKKAPAKKGTLPGKTTPDPLS